MTSQSAPNDSHHPERFRLAASRRRAVKERSEINCRVAYLFPRSAWEHISWTLRVLYATRTSVPTPSVGTREKALNEKMRDMPAAGWTTGQTGVQLQKKIATTQLYCIA